MFFKKNVYYYNELIDFLQLIINISSFLISTEEGNLILVLTHQRHSFQLIFMVLPLIHEKFRTEKLFPNFGADYNNYLYWDDFS